MAQHDTPAHSGKAIAILRVDAYTHGGIVVTSSAVDGEGRLDPLHSAAGDDTSPPLQWSGVLEAQSYALIVQDPDAPRDEPVIHWVMWDIPGAAAALPANLGSGVHPEGVRDAVQGLNSHGKPGWMGMAPPQGAGVHHYHFQLFAVNKRLGLRPDTSLEHLVEALKGTTIAKGELVGLFEIPDLAAGS